MAVSRTVARCGRAQRWEVALSLLHEARACGPQLTASVYLVTAQACARAGKWEEASSLMQASLGGPRRDPREFDGRCVAFGTANARASRVLIVTSFVARAVAHPTYDVSMCGGKQGT